MTLPGSGTISMSELQTEFGGSSPISFSEYYKSGGNGYVPSTVPDAVTASSLSGSHSTNLRGAQFGGFNPAINTTIAVQGSIVFSANLTPSGVGSTSTTGTFSASAGNTIGVVTSFPSSGWAGHYIFIGGSSYNNRSLSLPVNGDIPASGVTKLSDYYGGRAT